MRVYLAGAEMHGRPELLLGQKVKYVLGSYYYMRDIRKQVVRYL
jgi:energy-converting hydrogenase A subunit M